MSRTRQVICFNSIKVRLKPQTATENVLRRARFQFHKGPIKAQEGVTTKRCVISFQFHKGPIKA